MGMAKELYTRSQKAKILMDQANELLDGQLLPIMFEGPKEALMQTKWTQPAIFIHSISLWKEVDLIADAVAGHSLGEITALAAAGVLDFEEALQIVITRANGMQSAGEMSEGTMSAVVGLTDEQVVNLCAQATHETGEVVIAANFNSPGQVVISGTPKAVEKATELAKSLECRLVKPLDVSGAFHSPLMQPASEELAKVVAQTTFKKAQIPVYSNSTATAETDGDTLAENLLNQLTGPVRWTQTLLNMHQDQIRSFVEVGPGKALQGLCKRTLEDIEFSGIES